MGKTIVVVVNGLPGCGKTTFENLPTNFYEFSSSYVNYPKEVAKEIGWRGQKDPISRKYLAYLCDMMEYWNDGCMNNVKEKKTLVDVFPGVKILYIDARKPEVIDRLKKEFGAVTLLIRRNSCLGQSATCAADEMHSILGYNYDYEVFNNSTLEDLKKEKKRFLDWLLKEKEIEE